MSFANLIVRRMMLGSLAALGIVAGSGLALAPQPAHAYYEVTVQLYVRHFQVGSGQSEALRAECESAATAQRYNVQFTRAVVQNDADRDGHGGSLIRLECYGGYYSFTPREVGIRSAPRDLSRFVR